MDSIEFRMGEMCRYVITMIDEHGDYVQVLAVLQLYRQSLFHLCSPVVPCWNQPTHHR